MDNDLLERLVRLEVVTAEKQSSVEVQLQELKMLTQVLEDDFYALVQKHTEEEMIVMAKILAKLEGIETQTANFKGLIGGIIFAASAIWFVLAQVATWLHLDFIKLLSSALGK